MRTSDDQGRQGRAGPLRLGLAGDRREDLVLERRVRGVDRPQRQAQEGTENQAEPRGHNDNDNDHHHDDGFGRDGGGRRRPSPGHHGHPAARQRGQHLRPRPRTRQGPPLHQGQDPVAPEEPRRSHPEDKSILDNARVYDEKLDDYTTHSGQGHQSGHGKLAEQIAKKEAHASLALKGKNYQESGMTIGFTVIRSGASAVRKLADRGQRLADEGMGEQNHQLGGGGPRKVMQDFGQRRTEYCRTGQDGIAFRK